jgi:very-short-patch-repair endonuclease
MRSMVEGHVSGEAMRAPVLTFKRARRLRREMSLPEAILWEQLRRGALDGMRFRRQHPVGPYVLDFYCAASRLAVEVDGAGHDLPGQMHHDIRRDAWLAGQGVRTLRIAASDVLDDRALEGVLAEIAEAGRDAPG